MHEKLVVVVGTYALVGGINFADRYNDTDGNPAWLDYALYTEGEISFRLHQYEAKFWRKEEQCPKLLQPHFQLKEKPCSVKISYNDWVKRKHEIWRTYFNLFNQAEKSITILCSYFLPGRVLRHRLSLAAKRGVLVKLVLAGPTDIMLAKHAERYLYAWMLKNNIEIYEYQPSVLHAKIAVTDQHWLTIGSFNVNNISAYASMELNLDVRNKPFAAAVQKHIETIIEHDCIRITQQNYITKSGFFKRLFQKSCYELIRLILNLSTFYFKPQ
jgi:cardiolipin synthase